jgi:hypothetical protein
VIGVGGPPTKICEYVEILDDDLVIFRADSPRLPFEVPLTGDFALGRSVLLGGLALLRVEMRAGPATSLAPRGAAARAVVEALGGIT